MIPVFAYGTLRDPAYLAALFDRVPPIADGTLAGWLVVVTEGGYFSVIADENATTDGTLVSLTAAELERADRWEDVPVYERIRVTARTAEGAPIACWLYVRATESREAPPPGTFSLHAPERVIETIRAFRRGDSASALSLESPD